MNRKTRDDEFVFSIGNPFKQIVAALEKQFLGLLVAGLRLCLTKVTPLPRNLKRERIRRNDLFP
jgi:hypothetical protein